MLLPGGGRLHLLAANPTPPLFDGPERLNRRRNHDEIAFWARYLDGAGACATTRAGSPAPPAAPLVVLGDLNADPFDGDGLHEGIGRAARASARCRTRAPASAGAAAAAAQGGANARHAGPAALDTADWRDARGPGNLRVDYVLPSAELDGRRRRACSGRRPGEPMAAVAAEALGAPAGLGGHRAAGGRRPA